MESFLRFLVDEQIRFENVTRRRRFFHIRRTKYPLSKITRYVWNGRLNRKSGVKTTVVLGRERTRTLGFQSVGKIVLYQCHTVLIISTKITLYKYFARIKSQRYYFLQIQRTKLPSKLETDQMGAPQPKFCLNCLEIKARQSRFSSARIGPCGFLNEATVTSLRSTHGMLERFV